MDTLLIADIGNTSIKIAVADRNGLTASYSLPTKTLHSRDSLGLQFRLMLEDAGASRQDIVRCSVCSVVPELTGIFGDACVRYLGMKPAVFPEDFPPLMENRYANPLEVGADRLMAAYAARKLNPDAESVISVDFGTATTFDCVSGNAYLGGLICPGVLSAYGALASGTAKLPHMSFDGPEREGIMIGRDTVTSMRQGFLWSFRSMTEGICRRLKAELPGDCPVVATGGFARHVAGEGSGIDSVVPELVTEGLRLATLCL